MTAPDQPSGRAWGRWAALFFVLLAASVLGIFPLRDLLRSTLAPLRLITNEATNERDWSEDVARLPEARLRGDLLTVANLRNFDYRTVSEWTPRWEERTCDLRTVRSLWFVMEPFSPLLGAAHTFLSFGFADGSYLAVSVEVRKVKGDSFSPWRALWRGFEIAYVLGDERDLVRLRTNYRHDEVYLYPAKATPEQIRSLLLDVVERVSALRAKPEFYNTLTNTCATNILRHVNRVWPGRIPYGWRILMPAYSDRLAFDLGLIDHPGPFAEARRRWRINDKAAAADQSPEFSRLIREP
ncbi:MAG TPA: hypothetical protein DD417_09175 [Elusimicrobia bacterium]|nr:hypothetical protein [Elusimicrobiota bacterium]